MSKILHFYLSLRGVRRARPLVFAWVERCVSAGLFGVTPSLRSPFEDENQGCLNFGGLELIFPSVEVVIARYRHDSAANRDEQADRHGLGLVAVSGFTAEEGGGDEHEAVTENDGFVRK